jgi:hypothetical protein
MHIARLIKMGGKSPALLFIDVSSLLSEFFPRLFIGDRSPSTRWSPLRINDGIFPKNPSPPENIFLTVNKPGLAIDGQP